MTASATIAFDVYGTLGDLGGLVDDLDQLDDGPDLASRWRAHQLEITWLLTLMERYEDFEKVTAYALDVALAERGLQLSDDRRGALLRNVEGLELFPDAVPTLDRLGAAGFPLAVLSNGSPRMLEALLGNAGVRGHFGDVISVDEVGAYKPAPAVYRHAAQRLGRPIGEVWLVSGNPFDVAGAKAAGMRVAKIERQPSFRYPFAGLPDVTLSGLAELPEAIDSEASRTAHGGSDARGF